MQKLNANHTQEALAYLTVEPEFNLFLIGDIESMGIESEHVACYTSDSWQEGTTFPYFILIYRNNGLVYSHDINYNYIEVAEFLNTFHLRNISGKDSLITPLIPYVEDRPVQRTYMARLNQMNQPPTDTGFKVRRLTKQDIPAIYDLYIQIDEFASMYRTMTKEEAYKDISMNIAEIGRTYGVFEGDTLLSVAQTSAENSTSAMVVGVATLPAHRGCGYAKATVTKLCGDCLQGGMNFLCLFYDNPSAGRIYRSIGFQEIGIFTILRGL